ncbi:hypothetical protein PFISCL1PPCAC_16079, partial [Pristionchus fissidentatus]
KEKALELGVFQNKFGHIIYLRKGDTQEIVCVNSVSIDNETNGNLCVDESQERRFVRRGDKLPNKIEKFLARPNPLIRDSIVPCKVFTILDQI